MNYGGLYVIHYLEKEGEKEEKKRDRKMVCFAKAKNRRNCLKTNDLIKISLFTIYLIVLSYNTHDTVMRTMSKRDLPTPGVLSMMY